MGSDGSQREASTTFRRTVIGILIAASIIGWILGAYPDERGFLMFVLPICMGASFYGRAYAIPGATAVLAAQHDDMLTGLALAGMIVVLGERTHHLRNRLGRFAQRSFTDRLTGLFNYDFLQAQVRYEVDRVKRYGGSCTLLVLDLDNFKKFNDTHGHQAGNLLLRAVADVVRVEKRETDFAARFGGEEFVILVPGDSRDAMRLAERLRMSVEAIQLPQLGEDGKVTVSIGISSYPEQSDNAAELFERADQALYVAKGTGKNRVIVYPNVQIRQRTAADKRTA